MSRVPRRRRRRLFARRYRVARPGRMERLATAVDRPPITSITPPSAAQAASARTGSHLRARLSVVAFLIVALMSVLVVRLWSLQILQGPQLNSLARATTTVSDELVPPRGDIVARGGQVLAGDVATEQVELNPDVASANSEVVTRLAGLLQVSVGAIDEQIKESALRLGPNAPVPVPAGPSGVTPGDVLYIQSNAHEFPGVTVGLRYERTYPDGALAAQALGYVGDISSTELAQDAKDGYTAEDQFGQAGLESQYELALHGKPGSVVYATDPEGNIIGQVSQTAPVPGDTLVLNLDLGLEQTLTTALSNQLVALRDDANGTGAVPAPWGAAVALDPQTGAVLAMVSEPSYNNNDWIPFISSGTYNELVNAPGQPLNNYAIASLQPPGSTFKLATSIAALDDGLIDSSTLIDDPGSFTLGDHTYYDTAESSGAGWLNVTQALTQSNDIFFYNLGADFWYDAKKYGVDAIQDVANALGLGVQTGIDLPGQATGQIDSPQLRIDQHREDPAAFPYEQYEPGDNVEMAFGQGETVVNPIELATAYATFANGGTRYAPEMAAAIVNPDGKVVRTMAPKVTGHVALPASTYDPILAGLEGAVQDSDGTAYGAFQGFDFSSWNIAGKTGTASVSAGDVNEQPTSWFVAFGGPRGEKPQYLVVVEIDQGGYGAQASAPVARQAFDYLYHHPIAAVSLP